MRKIILLIVVCACFCAGASCSVSCDGSPIPWPNVDTELDRATCTIRIAENATGGTATAMAEITTAAGWPVELGEGQSVQVNGQPMAAAGDSGEYAVTIPAAGTYTVTVTEPTRGVQTTSQPTPPDFQITSPTEGGPASLSGFTVSYSNPDAALQVSIKLVQTLFGHEEQMVVGPLADTGSKSFTAQDLAEFRQGADLSIAVTKISRHDGINGFAAGQLSVERTRSVKAKPQP